MYISIFTYIIYIIYIYIYIYIYLYIYIYMILSSAHEQCNHTIYLVTKM